jgi:hypothetical protein
VRGARGNERGQARDVRSMALQEGGVGLLRRGGAGWGRLRVRAAIRCRATAPHDGRRLWAPRVRRCGLHRAAARVPSHTGRHLGRSRGSSGYHESERQDHGGEASAHRTASVSHKMCHGGSHPRASGVGPPASGDGLPFRSADRANSSETGDRGVPCRRVPAARPAHRTAKKFVVSRKFTHRVLLRGSRPDARHRRG